MVTRTSPDRVVPKRSSMRRGLALAGSLLATAAFMILCPAPVAAGQITITDSVGVPDRGDTSRAIDGNLATETYTTPSNTTDQPSYLELGFASAQINRIRLYKDNYVAPHDLVIEYTTDTGLLTSRSWTAVSNLANGIQGSELLVATSVNSNGTVTGDNHNSPGGDGWASLMFDTVTATGIRIVFTNSGPFNHYHVYEFEAWYMSQPLFSIGRDTWCDTTCNARLYMVDPSNAGDLGSIRLKMSGHLLNCRQNGLAVSPGGTLYATVWPDGCYGASSRLVTIDPDTGTVTDIGSLGDKFATLTFLGSTLYGATGNNSSAARTLFSIDSGTAAATPRCHLGGSTGQAVAAGPSLLYHAADGLFESIDPGSFPGNPADDCATTVITSDPFSEPAALVSSGSDFLLSTVYQELLNLTSGGSVSSAGTLSHISKGLAFASASPRRADLAISKIGAKVRQNGQRYINYTITVVNYGPDDAYNVAIEDSLGAYQTHQSDDGGCAVTGNLITCPVGTLYYGSEATVNVTVLLSSPGKVKTVSNTASVFGEVYETAAELTNSATTVYVSTKGK